MSMDEKRRDQVIEAANKRRGEHDGTYVGVKLGQLFAFIDHPNLEILMSILGDALTKAQTERAAALAALGTAQTSATTNQAAATEVATLTTANALPTAAEITAATAELAAPAAALTPATAPAT
jgi:hypothetical protein